MAAGFLSIAACTPVSVFHQGFNTSNLSRGVYAEQIRVARALLNWSQAELAQRSGGALIIPVVLSRGRCGAAVPPRISDKHHS